MLKMNFDFVEFQPKRNDFRNEKKKITNVRTRKEFRKMKIKEWNEMKRNESWSYCLNKVKATTKI